MLGEGAGISVDGQRKCERIGVARAGNFLTIFALAGWTALDTSLAKEGLEFGHLVSIPPDKELTLTHDTARHRRRYSTLADRFHGDSGSNTGSIAAGTLPARPELHRGRTHEKSMWRNVFHMSAVLPRTGVLQ